jgi:hypothetical protein
MPKLTVTHEAPLELIRQHPALAVDLLREITDLPLPDDLDIRLGPTSLNAVVPAEFTADSVVIVSDQATGSPEMVIVVEPQGRAEETKKFSWPAYLAMVRRAVRCERAVLIVVCPDAAEADKCREPIPMGHPGWDLWPLVIDPDHAPGAEGAGPYLILFLACLPALNMETEAGARRVLAAIRDTRAPEAERKILTTVILKRASEAARQLLEEMMTTVEWKDDFIESFVQQGLEQGVVQARREDVLKVLGSRGIMLTDQQRAEVATCSDLATLDLWFDRSLTAASADDVFKA